MLRLILKWMYTYCYNCIFISLVNSKDEERFNNEFIFKAVCCIMGDEVLVAGD